MMALAISCCRMRHRISNGTIIILRIKLVIEGSIPVFPVRELHQIPAGEAAKGTLFWGHLSSLETIDEQVVDKPGKVTHIYSAHRITITVTLCRTFKRIKGNEQVVNQAG